MTSFTGWNSASALVDWPSPGSADRAVILLPDSPEARRAAAMARMQRAARQEDAASTDADLDEAVQLLDLAGPFLDEPALRSELGAALVARQTRRAQQLKERRSHDEWEKGRSSRPGGVAETRRVVERLTQLRELSPDDLQLKTVAVRGKLLLAEALLDDSEPDGGRAEARAAAELARDILSRRPEHPEAAALLRRAEALSAR